MGLSRTLLTLVAVILAALAPASRIEGKATYSERLILPRDSYVTVRLEEANPEARTISELKFDVGGRQSPFNFSLYYSDAAVRPNVRYQLRAMVNANGRPIFASAKPVAWKPGSAGPMSILMSRTKTVGPIRIEGEGIGGLWKLVEVGKLAAIRGQNGVPTLNINIASRTITGNTGINAYSGTFALEGANLTFRDIRQTLMAGPENLMVQERALTEALANTSTYQIAGGRLRLTDGGQILATFARS